jgi:hypothetical protein
MRQSLGAAIEGGAWEERRRFDGLILRKSESVLFVVEGERESMVRGVETKEGTSRQVFDSMVEAVDGPCRERRDLMQESETESERERGAAAAARASAPQPRSDLSLAPRCRPQSRENSERKKSVKLHRKFVVDFFLYES